MSETHPFLEAFRGNFSGVLRWHQLDALWALVLSSPSDRWYVYAVGEEPPTTPQPSHALSNIVRELDELLHREHDEDYCGIVYVDNMHQPTYIKIFDPNNLGSTCGSSGNPPLPGWILSHIPPTDLPMAFPQPNNRRRWWQKLFNHA
ncbi:hypothetical protein [Thiothrix lacustris]|jgi:hypothetical protein|uniref:Uncharacterized protein n=1 Tax=Thiothrix lacustris TaxID=525917 RepID=A0ABY9MSH6_9GAMM|nr:hypothetical protein [Thiothrix lacustris]WML91146.1 hypothetical protein RCF98_02045 [Thiothrix lacustris]WMP16945.1 hypothetical protein RCS87_16415 [Thiothrix lacustris]